LFDSGAGSGKTFSWGALRGISPAEGVAEDPEGLERGGDFPRLPFFLAGGINLGNIGAAMALKPYAIDVSSGAETNGVKDREKIILLCKGTGKFTCPFDGRSQL
jgi:phosphoribosylanthranilate isomerase